MLLYQAWQADYHAPPAQEPPASIATEDSSGAAAPSATDVPNLIGQATPGPAKEPPAIPEATAQTVRVNTDNYRLQIHPRGAGIVKAELLKFPVDVERPQEPFVLMDHARDLLFITQGGLLSSADAPTHATDFSTAEQEYTLGPDQELLEVPFLWTAADGLIVRKIFEFRRGTYQIGVRYEITNQGGAPWSGRSYAQLKRNNPGRPSMFGTYTYTGAVISSPESRYEKISFDDIEEQELQQDIVNGWAAMIQHYFVSALIPADKNLPHHYYTQGLADGNFAIGMMTPAVTVAPGETKIIREQLYIGPKIQEVLEKTADRLELTVDYGWLWFIAKPLFWVLEKLHLLTGNWGWAIVLVTLMLRLVFFPLATAQYRSMANMRKVQPRLMAIRERYQNDKARMNQAMMQLYKEEKINPLGGCLPILVQIPVFLALYFVLLESVEMRQSGFIFWIRDLSSPDPYYVLPLLMGVTMFITQKMNPAPIDPVQAKVMTILPVIFTVFFVFFQSGLVLYWVVNNILSILQQWLITRRLERAGPQPKKTG